MPAGLRKGRAGVWWLCRGGAGGTSAFLGTGHSWRPGTGPASSVSVRRALEPALKVGLGPLGDPRPQGGGGTGGSGEAGTRETQRKRDRWERMASETQRGERQGEEEERERWGVSTYMEMESTSVARERERQRHGNEGDRNLGQECDGPAWPGRGLGRPSGDKA